MHLESVIQSEATQKEKKKYILVHMEKKCKKAKWLFGEALLIAEKRREVKSMFREPACPLGTRGLELAKRRVLRVVLDADRGSQLSYGRAPG